MVARAASQQRGQLARGGPGLQVPAVALYPSRKKVPVKDLPPFGETRTWRVTTLPSAICCHLVAVCNTALCCHLGAVCNTALCCPQAPALLTL